MKSVFAPFLPALPDTGEQPTSFSGLADLLFAVLLKRSFVKSKDN